MQYAVQRAIILAAGRGKRLRPLTDKCPKPLLEVKGKPIIEHTIEAMISRGIKEILIVTGYKHKKFDYLVSKYSGKAFIVTNQRWKESNLTSMHCALPYMHVDANAAVMLVDGDTIIKPEAIKQKVSHSMYCYTDETEACEWSMKLDKGGKIIEVIEDLSEKKSFHALRSFSYWAGNELAAFRFGIQYAHDSKLQPPYYDNIALLGVNEGLRNLYGCRVSKKDFVEIDTIADIESAEKRIDL